MLWSGIELFGCGILNYFAKTNQRLKAIVKSCSVSHKTIFWGGRILPLCLPYTYY